MEMGSNGGCPRLYLGVVTRAGYLWSRKLEEGERHVYLTRGEELC